MTGRQRNGVKRMAGFFLLGLAVSVGAVEEDGAIKVRFLLQPWIQLEKEAAPDGKSWSKEAYLRRSRIIISGQVHERIRFFVETDIPNWGKNGNWSSAMYVQDAYVDFTLVKELGIIDSLNAAVGMILLPFSRHNRQSAASLNTLDYHSSLIRFLPDSHKAWRDSGVELRGLFLGKNLDIRMGIFNGLRGTKMRAGTLNPDDSPRFTGRVQYNVFDTEDGFFYGGNHLGAKRILAFGVGLDHQKNAVYIPLLGGGWLVDYTAVSADLFLDWPLGDNLGFIGLLNYYSYDYGDQSPLGFPPSMTGKGCGLELGLRYRKWEPVFFYERFSPKYEAALDDFYTRGLRFGLNYWLLGHTANIKLEFASMTRKTVDLKSANLSRLTIQTQLLF